MHENIRGDAHGAPHRAYQRFQVHSCQVKGREQQSKIVDGWMDEWMDGWVDACMHRRRVSGIDMMGPVCTPTKKATLNRPFCLASSPSDAIFSDWPKLEKITSCPARSSEYLAQSCASCKLQELRARSPSCQKKARIRTGQSKTKFRGQEQKCPC